MLKRKYSILAGAVLAATPLVGKAVTLTFTYDANDFSYSASSTAGSGVGTYVAATNTLTVTPGTIIDLGVDETVTANPNTAPGVYTKVAQPTALGIAAFGMGFNTNNSAVASFDAGQDNGSISIDSDFTASTGGGVVTSGQIVAPTVSGGVIVSSIKSSTTSGTAQLSYGAGTAAELFNSLQIDAGTTTGTTTITATGINAADEGYIVYNSGGSTTSSAPVYKSVSPTVSDTITNLPALTIIVAGGTTTTVQPIISLIPGGTIGTSYGTPDGALALNGSNGSYRVATATGFTTATTGAVVVAGFNPVTDKEVYALKLSQNGVPIASTSTTLAAIIADINGANGNQAAVGVTASAVTAPYTTLFPGYDILLTSVAGYTAGTLGTSELEFDFSGTGEQNAADAGITVTAVAAVPEPATAAGLILGAAGLLLGRRKNRVTVA